MQRHGITSWRREKCDRVMNCDALHSISAISAGTGAMVDPAEFRELLE
jgi:hypothetical protein